MLLLVDADGRDRGITDREVSEGNLMNLDVGKRNRVTDDSVLSDEIVRVSRNDLSIWLASECLDHFEALVARNRPARLGCRAYLALDQRRNLLMQRLGHRPVGRNPDVNVDAALDVF